MKKLVSLRATAIALVLSCAPLLAQSSPIAIINIQDAITRTEEGQKLIKELQERYAPKSKELEAMQAEVSNLRAKLNQGANTMSEDAKRDLVRQIQQKERDGQRAVEDARGEFNQEQQKIFNEIGGKLMTVITQFASEKNYSIVLDISSPQSPVLYAVNEVNITNDVIAAYDAGGAAAAPNDGAAGKPAP